jgi:hypothetical protein
MPTVSSTAVLVGLFYLLCSLLIESCKDELAVLFLVGWFGCPDSERLVSAPEDRGDTNTMVKSITM